MPQFPRSLGVAICVLLAARPAIPQIPPTPEQPTIAHEPIDCIVAGHYPQLAACLQPARDSARGRLYFQAEGRADWYFVEMKSDSPCWKGVLPKPSSALVHQHIHYYFEGTWRNLVTARTPEYSRLVVRSKAQCKRPLVPAIAAGGPAAVLPLVPAGFSVAGLPPALAVLGAGALAGGAAAFVVAAPAYPPPTPAPQPSPVSPSPTPSPIPTPVPTPGPTPTPIPTPTPTPSPTPTPTPAPTPTPTPMPTTGRTLLVRKTP